MFNNIYDSNNRNFCMYVTITCKTPEKKRFRVWAEEYGKKNSKYADRCTHKDICIDGKISIHLSFPSSPKKLFIGVLNAENPQDKDFDVVLVETPLKTYNIDISDETKRFVSMAAKFSQVCGHESAGDMTPRTFKNENNEFVINYFNLIKDRLTGNSMSTPARIGHSTGIIEVAKCKFDRYTIPMRLIILLHEYSHKYRNPKIGLEISNEKGADINALYIYLGLGYSKIDAITVFAKVFYAAQTPGNINRMRLIIDYIKRFDNQEFAQLNS